VIGMGKVYIFEISAKGWWKTNEDGLRVSNPLPKPSDFFIGQSGRSIEGDMYYNGGKWRGLLEYEVWKQAEIDPEANPPNILFYRETVRESINKPEDLNEEKTTYKRYTVKKRIYPNPEDRWRVMTHNLCISLHGLCYNTRNMSIILTGGYEQTGYVQYYDTNWQRKVVNFFRCEIFYRCVLEIGGVVTKRRYEYLEAKLRPFELIPFTPDVYWIDWKLERWLEGDEIKNYLPNEFTDGITFEIGNYIVFYPDKLTLKTNYSDFYPRLRFANNFQTHGVNYGYYEEDGYYVFSAEVEERDFRLIWEGYSPYENPPRTYYYIYDDDKGSQRRMFVTRKRPFVAFYRHAPVQPYRNPQGEIVGGLGRVNDLGAYDKVYLKFPVIHEVLPDPNTPIMPERINVKMKILSKVIDIGTLNKELGDFEIGGKIVRWLYRYDEPYEPYPDVYPTKRPYDEEDFKEGVIFRDRLKTSLGYEFDVYAIWHCDGTLVVAGFCDKVIGYEWSFSASGWSVTPKTERVQTFGFEAVGLDPNRYFVNIFRSPSGKKIHFLAYDRASGTLYEVLTVSGGDVE